MELSHSNKRATKIIWNIPSSPSNPIHTHTHIFLCALLLWVWTLRKQTNGRLFLVTMGGLQDLGKQIPYAIWNRNHASCISYCLTPFCSVIHKLFFFFATQNGMWDLSSMTRDRTSPLQWTCTTGLSGKSHP